MYGSRAGSRRAPPWGPPRDDGLVVHEEAAALLEELLVAQGLDGLERHKYVGRARVADHGVHVLAHADDGRDGPASLAHAVDL